MAVFIFLRNSLPEAVAGCFAPIAYDKCHDLPCSTTHGRPHPLCLLFLLDKAPDFVQLENIIWYCGQKRFLNRRQVQSICSEPARNRLPRNDKDSCNSTQTTTLQTGSQYGLLLCFRIGLLWPEDTIRPTVLAMIL